MTKLLHSAITSLGGYVAGRAGTFDRSVPGDEGHACINKLMRPVGTHLYCRRPFQESFRAAGGTHDDWATYDRVRREEPRAAVLITPRRAYGNTHTS